MGILYRIIGSFKEHNPGINGRRSGIIACGISILAPHTTRPSLGPTVLAGDCSLTMPDCSNSSSGKNGCNSSCATAQLSKFLIKCGQMSANATDASESPLSPAVPHSLLDKFRSPMLQYDQC